MSRVQFPAEPSTIELRAEHTTHSALMNRMKDPFEAQEIQRESINFNWIKSQMRNYQEHRIINQNRYNRVNWFLAEIRRTPSKPSNKRQFNIQANTSYHWQWNHKWNPITKADYKVFKW